MAEETGAATPRRIRRQRLGIRLSIEPYYAVAEQTPTCLVLQSQPGANARAGRLPMGCGILVGLLTPLIIFMFAGTSGSNLAGGVVFGALLAWPFIAIGFLIWNGGRAVATTSNSITVDSEAQTITYSQVNRAHRPRSQTLQFEQIDHVRLRSRPAQTPGFFRRQVQVVALEMMTDEGYLWLVDSGTDPDALHPVATAMAQLIGVPLHDERAPLSESRLQPSE
jgi:hypothetical protein